jgi:tetratricopeptide (TPR) repeat protein
MVLNHAAIRYFHDALAANPRHFRARLYLRETLLQSGDLETAVAELEKAYQLDREEARLPLARVLVAQARTRLEAQDEETGLDLLEQALAISPQERDAQTLRYEIWTRRGDQALQENDLDAALDAYRQVDNQEGLTRVNNLQTRERLASLEREAEAHEKAERWDEALASYEKLLAAAPDETVKIEWEESRQRTQQAQQLARRFAEGLGFLEQQAWDNAVRAFIDVIQQRPQYSRNGVLAVNLLQDAVQHEPGSHKGKMGGLRPYSQKIPLFHRWWRVGGGLAALALLVFGVIWFEDSGDVIFAAVALFATAAICVAIAVDHFQANRRIRGVIFSLAALPLLFTFLFLTLFEPFYLSRHQIWSDPYYIIYGSLYYELLFPFVIFITIPLLLWIFADAIYGQGIYPAPLFDHAAKLFAGTPGTRASAVRNAASNGWWRVGVPLAAIVVFISFAALDVPELGLALMTALIGIVALEYLYERRWGRTVFFIITTFFMGVLAIEYYRYATFDSTRSHYYFVDERLILLALGLGTLALLWSIIDAVRNSLS